MLNGQPLHASFTDTNHSHIKLGPTDKKEAVANSAMVFSFSKESFGTSIVKNDYTTLWPFHHALNRYSSIMFYRHAFKRCNFRTHFSHLFYSNYAVQCACCTMHTCSNTWWIYYMSSHMVPYDALPI